MADVTDDETSIDGRSLRSARSRRAVVDAFLDLVHEGETQPTAQQVSERSGVSPSTIFRLFDDLEEMHAEAMAAQVERVAHLLVEIPRSGPLDDRVAQLVRARARLYEAVTPTLRFQRRLVAVSPAARSNQAATNARFRAEMARVFADELAATPARTLDSIDALASWEMWERLRTVQDLSIKQARALLHHWLMSALSPGRRA